MVKNLVCKQNLDFEGCSLYPILMELHPNRDMDLWNYFGKGDCGLQFCATLSGIPSLHLGVPITFNMEQIDKSISVVGM